MSAVNLSSNEAIEIALELERMHSHKGRGRLASGNCKIILALMLAGLFVIFYESYKRAHTFGIEQPVTPYGLADYFFRHPEKLFGFMHPEKLFDFN
jgi:hypothetical protein